ncbi:MAG TPA: hypothetical protein VGJ07_11500 [Rugosimonospora sp.]|jgi:ABC-type amino acid transport system permease subunit
MVLIFLLGVVVGCLLGWWAAQRMAGFRNSGNDSTQAQQGFVAGLVAGFIAFVKGAALFVVAVVVLFVLAFLIAPLPKH